MKAVAGLSDAYKKAGVDLRVAADLKKSIAATAATTFNGAKSSAVGGFGAVVEADADANYLLVSSTDGVGTKTRIHAALKKWELSGWDIVNHCINDILPTGALPLFFLDYIGLGEYRRDVVNKLVQGVADACRSADTALVGGETAAMPGFYGEGDYELVGFIVGRVDRQDLLRPQESIKAGDTMLGIPSSGLHTNGYSLVRSIFNSDNSPDILNNKVPQTDKTLGEALATPHRSYLNELKPLLGENLIKGLAHITGGGVHKNIPRILPRDCAAVIDRSGFTVPPLFEHIRRSGDISMDEMFTVFNMGIGMAVVCDPSNEAQLLKAIPQSWRLGEVVAREADQQVILEKSKEDARSS